MATGPQCPSCSATVRAGDPWCTLCWTDLRPKPAPPSAPAPPPPAPALPPGPAPAGQAQATGGPARTPAGHVPAPVPLTGTPTAAATAAALADPLTAPLAAVMGWPLAADPEAPSTATWPCVSCGARNALELNVCGTCATPFGGRITRIDDVKGQRRKVLVISLSVAALFLVLLAAATLVGTQAPPKNPAPTTPGTVVVPGG